MKHLSVLLGAVLLLGACAAAPAPTPEIIVKTVEIPGPQPTPQIINKTETVTVPVAAEECTAALDDADGALNAILDYLSFAYKGSVKKANKAWDNFTVQFDNYIANRNSCRATAANTSY